MATETGSDWGRITVYDPSMAPKVAAMFQAFDELWPGGFGGGVPYTEQRVHDRYDKSTGIADLIALDADGEPVGYCGVYPHWRDADAAYVTVLGVVPRVKGKGYGKRLLLKAVETATAKGLKRLDLHTWSGNLAAVPLYKKIGMFWVPDTSVYMQDYLPGLFQMSVAKPYFAKHPDWYADFKRELAQAQDRYTVENMDLYTYVFQSGADRLVAEVDRYAWGFCSVERELDGGAIAVKTRLRAHEILMGLPNAMTLSITNRGDHDLDVALTVEPFKGLRWSEPFPLSLHVPEGLTRTVTREFTVDKDAERFDADHASSAIRSRIIWEGEVLDLVTGGKIRPAVDVSSPDGYVITFPGVQAEAYLDLANNAKEALSGKVSTFVEGLAGSHRVTDFHLAPEEISGLHVPVTPPAGDEETTRLLHATVSLDSAQGPVDMPAYRQPIVADGADLACALENNKGDRVTVLTDLLEVNAQLEGGRVDEGRRGVPGLRSAFGFQAGPPFGLGPDETLRYTYDSIRDGASLILKTSAESRQFPGLMIRKETRVTPGVRLVEHRVMLTNVRAEGAISVGGRLGVWGRAGFLDPTAERARAYTPIGDRIVESDDVFPFMDRYALPTEPAAWTETWTAAESLANGDLDAWFWRPEGVQKVWAEKGSLSLLEVAAKSLAPGETYEVVHVWWAPGLASVAEVRQRWSQLVSHVPIPFAERRQGVPTRGPVEARLLGDNALLAGEAARREVEFGVATRYPLGGELRLAAPAGWSAAFVTPDGQKPAIPTPTVEPGAPARLEIEITPPADAAGTCQAVHLRHVAEFELDLPLPVLVMGPGAVTVGPREVEGKPVLAVDNGALRFWVVGDIGGNLIRLYDAQERPFLFDSFPKVAPRFFVEHHLGGIEPIAFPAAMEEEPFKKLEQVSAEPVEEGHWRGVRARWTAHYHERLRGQEYAVTYLTLPGSNVLRLRFDHHNSTPRRVDWIGLLYLDVDFGPGGGLDIEAPGGTATWLRHPMRHEFASHASERHGWVRLSRGDQSLVAAAAEGSHGVVQAFDWGMTRAVMMTVSVRTEPQSDGRAEFVLALNAPGGDDAETLRAALSDKR